MNLLRRLQAIWESDKMTVAIVGLAVGTAINTITKLVEQRTQDLEVVNAQLAERRAELAALEAPLSPAPAGTYPAREDLAPLREGEDDRG